MLVSDIYQEIREMTGLANEAANFRALTRGIEVLANKGLCDPLLGYLDFYVSGGYTVALPREVKAPIRVNLNSNPAFPRDRLFEFAMNTAGSVDEEEIGWSWSDRLQVPVQDETQFPGKLKYVLERSEDDGAICTIRGRDIDGVERTEQLVGSVTGSAETTYDYINLASVRRTTTAGEAYLSVGGEVIARYDADETNPRYRAIKLSKTGVAVRILFRRHVFAITAQDDELPLSSAMAIIQGCKAARLMLEEKWEEAEFAITKAKEFLDDEQSSLQTGHEMSDSLDARTATDTNIATREVVIVGDIYDDAAKICGAIGRQKLFDKITSAVECLSNAKHWESGIGWCDLWRSENTTEINPRGRNGNGWFVLPRDVERVLAITISGSPMKPTNGWHEFHINGYGELNHAPSRQWKDMGETVLINRLPIDEDTRRVTPSYVVAVPDLALDNDTAIRVYGIEELPDGRQVEVYRDGAKGWACPCTFGSLNPGNGAPRFVRIDRITKAASTGFIRFVLVTRGAVEAIGAVDNPASGVFELVYSGATTLAVDDEFILDDVIYEVVSIVGMVPTVRDEITFAPAATFEDGATVYLASEDFTESTLLGYWHPEETEPNYQLIQTDTGAEAKIRIKFRRRWHKFTSMYDWIPLRSREAVLAMLRCNELRSTDPVAAANHETVAHKLLRDELRASRPHAAVSIQVHSDTWPGHTDNIF